MYVRDLRSRSITTGTISKSAHDFVKRFQDIPVLKPRASCRHKRVDSQKTDTIMVTKDEIFIGSMSTRQGTPGLNTAGQFTCSSAHTNGFVQNAFS